MRFSVLVAALAVAAPAFAQAPDASFNDTQKLGLRLFSQSCGVCHTPVQRIRYADKETNYCPRCQTGGRLLADRALSRLLKQDWPKSVAGFDGES